MSAGIRIQRFWSVRIRIQGFDGQTLKKKMFTANKNIHIIWSKLAIYLSLALHNGRPRPRYMRSLHPSKDNIQHFITWSFLLLWVIFARPPGFPMWIRIHNPGCRTFSHFFSVVELFAGSGSGINHFGSGSDLYPTFLLKSHIFSIKCTKNQNI